MPTMLAPFLSFYTPTYRRPEQLQACMESVRQQTAVADVEQIVVPDHVGLGVGGMFERVPRYAAALHGRYVHFLCDDDILASPNAVARVRLQAGAEDYPDVMIVGSQKPGGMFPSANEGPPVLGSIDLGCFIVERSVWTEFAHCYGRRYEGDFDFISHLWEVSREGREWAGLRWSWHRELHFVTGAASRGRYEGQWP